MEGFFKLISYYQTQSEPAYCGLATLAVVLNALEIDPGRKWKGPWRWFDDSMLDCCEPLSKIKVEGISFGKVACLAHCNGAKVKAFRTSQSTVDDFRNKVISCSSSEDCHVITSYHRAHLKQTGTGHFSPIGGYHAGSDMVLILDVARFKYPPHWIPLTLLWEAMDTVDEATGQHRGFMIISKLHKAPSILYTVTCRHENWNIIANYLVNEVPSLLKSLNVKDVQDVISLVFKSSSTDLREFIKWIAEVRRREDGNAVLSQEERGRLAMKEEVLKQVRETQIYKHVARWLASECTVSKDSSDDKDSLLEIATNVCCQEAQNFPGTLVSPNENNFPMETKVNFLRANNEKSSAVVVGTVTSNDTKQEFDVLVPYSETRQNDIRDGHPSSSHEMHPSTSDVLTVLFLVLPPHAWSGVAQEKLKEEIHSLVSTANLPPLLQEEILHLRRQLHFVMTDFNFSSPLPT